MTRWIRSSSKRKRRGRGRSSRTRGRAAASSSQARQQLQQRLPRSSHRRSRRLPPCRRPLVSQHPHQQQHHLQQPSTQQVRVSQQPGSAVRQTGNSRQHPPCAAQAPLGVWRSRWQPLCGVREPPRLCLAHTPCRSLPRDLLPACRPRRQQRQEQLQPRGAHRLCCSPWDGLLVV